VILTNPPFGGKEGKEAQKNYSLRDQADAGAVPAAHPGELKPALDGRTRGGRCAVVLDEGLLFRTNESAFVETKRKLLDECDLWCIVSLPGGRVFHGGRRRQDQPAVLHQGTRTERIWYYDLSQVKMGKKTPMTLAHFGWGPNGEILDDAALPVTLVADWREREGNAGKPFPSFARMLPKLGKPEAETDLCWTVDFSARRTRRGKIWRRIWPKSPAHKAEVVALKDEVLAMRKVGAGDTAIAERRERLAVAEKRCATRRPRRTPSMRPCSTSRR
jgi:type I restriction enzyme M protein